MLTDWKLSHGMHQPDWKLSLYWIAASARWTIALASQQGLHLVYRFHYSQPRDHVQLLTLLPFLIFHASQFPTLVKAITIFPHNGGICSRFGSVLFTPQCILDIITFFHRTGVLINLYRLVAVSSFLNKWMFLRPHLPLAFGFASLFYFTKGNPFFDPKENWNICFESFPEFPQGYMPLSASGLEWLPGWTLLM